MLQSLKASSAATPYLSRYLLEELKLTEAFYFNFEAPRARLALIDAGDLQQLFLYVGLTLRSGEIRGALDGARLKRLRLALGAEALDFVMKRVPLLGKLPQFAFDQDLPNPRDRMILVGAIYSLLPSAASDPAYMGRLALKLPSSLGHDLLKAGGQGPGEAGTDLRPLTRRLMREIIPRWLSFVRRLTERPGLDAAAKVLKAEEVSQALEGAELLADAEESARQILENAEAEYEAQKKKGYADGQAASQEEVAEQMLNMVSRSVDYLAGAERDVVKTVLICLRENPGRVQRRGNRPARRPQRPPGRPQRTARYPARAPGTASALTRTSGRTPPRSR